MTLCQGRTVPAAPEVEHRRRETASSSRNSRHNPHTPPERSSSRVLPDILSCSRRRRSVAVAVVVGTALAEVVGNIPGRLVEDHRPRARLLLALQKIQALWKDRMAQGRLCPYLLGVLRTIALLVALGRGLVLIVILCRHSECRRRLKSLFKVVSLLNIVFATVVIRCDRQQGRWQRSS